MKRCTIIILALLMVSGIYAQDQVSFSGQIRQRFEMSSKGFDGEPSTNINWLRSRLNVKFTPSEDVTGFFQIQDTRRFGDESGGLADAVNDLDLHQAYFTIDKFNGLPLSLKVGRMEVVYGPERLIGAVGWSNVARTWDGVIAKVNIGDINVDIFNLKEVETGAADELGDKNFTGAYGDMKLSGQTVQPFILWQQGADRSRFTGGFYAKGNFGGIHHETEFAYQTGDITANTTAAAMMFAFNAGMKVGGIDITAGMDYISGDDASTTNVNENFDTMYATNHKYYGFMDYFLSTTGYNGVGLMDLHVRTAMNLVDDTSLKVAAHMFSANQDYILSGGGTARDYGQEIDFTVTTKYNANFSYVLGASVALPGAIFKDVVDSDEMSTWFYFMTIVNL